MAKRFISTELFDDDWFMELKPTTKLLWVYFITKCDHAGIISFNERLCKFQTGLNDVQGCLKELKSRVFRLSDTQFFIPKFIYFQYPDFPNSKVNQQKGAIKILTKLGLMIDNQLIDLTTLDDVQSLSKTYVYVNDNVNGIGESEGNQKPKKDIPEYQEFLAYFKTLSEVYKPELEFSLKSKYESWVENNWKDGNGKKISNWKTKLKNTIPYLRAIQPKPQEREIKYDKI
jgi:hypothetical protein